MSTYQKDLHHSIHGPNEPLPSRLISRLNVSPYKDTLPSLPNALSNEQKSPEQLYIHHPLPPGHVSPLPDRDHDFPTGVICKHSSELLLNSDPNAVMTRYFPPLESLTDPLKMIERLKREPELGFLYLTPVEERHSIKYNPYNLR